MEVEEIDRRGRGEGWHGRRKKKRQVKGRIKYT